jgi:hypothetical protein
LDGDDLDSRLFFLGTLALFFLKLQLEGPIFLGVKLQLELQFVPLSLKVPVSETLPLLVPQQL